MNRRKFIKAASTSLGIGVFSTRSAAGMTNGFGDVLIKWVEENGKITERIVRYQGKSWYGEHFEMDFIFSNGNTESIDLFVSEGRSIARYSGGWAQANWNEIDTQSTTASTQSHKGVELPQLSLDTGAEQTRTVQATADPEIIEKRDSYWINQGDCWWNRCADHQLVAGSIKFGEKVAAVSGAVISTTVIGAFSSMLPGPIGALIGNKVVSAALGALGGTFVGRSISMGTVDYDLLLPIKEYPVTKDRLMNICYGIGWKVGVGNLVTVFTGPGHHGDC